MDKELNWETLQEDEGKFALGFILAKELEAQARNRPVRHVGTFVTIDLLGKLQIGPIVPAIPDMSLEDKIKTMLEVKLSEEEIVRLLAMESK